MISKHNRIHNNLTAFLQLILELVSKDKNETKKQSESFRNVYL